MDERIDVRMDEKTAVSVAGWLTESNRYGSVEGLPDEELADPDELERMVYLEEFGPVLRLPMKERRYPLYGSIDEDGRVDFGAFGTVDFDRYRGQFDKTRYKIDKLREQLKDLVLMLTMVNERIAGKAKYKVLKYVRMGILDLGDIEDNQMYFFAEMYLRAIKLRQEIAKLQEAARHRRLRQMGAWLDTPDG